MLGSISCAFIRNWVWPPMMACMISCLPYIIGWALSQHFNLLLMVSRIGSHGVILLTLLLTHAPRIHTALPSWVIRIFSGSVVSSVELIFLLSVTIFQCASIPMGMISVLSMLNLAPDTWHHLFRTSCMCSSLFSLLRNRFVSSANSLVLISGSIPSIFIPLMF
jgi:hypothetical protein